MPSWASVAWSGVREPILLQFVHGKMSQILFRRLRRVCKPGHKHSCKTMRKITGAPCCCAFALSLALGSRRREIDVWRREFRGRPKVFFIWVSDILAPILFVQPSHPGYQIISLLFCRALLSIVSEFLFSFTSGIGHLLLYFLFINGNQNKLHELFDSNNLRPLPDSLASYYHVQDDQIAFPSTVVRCYLPHRSVFSEEPHWNRDVDALDVQITISRMFCIRLEKGIESTRLFCNSSLLLLLH